jgi:hypothetical protein
LEYCPNFTKGPKSDNVTQVKNTESGKNLASLTKQTLKILFQHGKSGLWAMIFAIEK